MFDPECYLYVILIKCLIYNDKVTRHYMKDFNY